MNEWETCIDEWAERLRVSQKETADAQATIADLQEKIAVERANKESAVACVDRDVKKISALQQRVAQLEGKLVSMTESRDAWQKSQEGTEKAYMALATQIPSERFDYDPVNLALLESAKEQEEIGRKQIADLQSSLSRLTQKYAYIEKEAALAYEKIATLQADHARVLGLLAQVTEIADMMLKGTECEHDVGLCSCEHRRIVKQAQRSLPAQPAQGGA